MHTDHVSSANQYGYLSTLFPLRASDMILVARPRRDEYRNLLALPFFIMPDSNMPGSTIMILLLCFPEF